MGAFAPLSLASSSSVDGSFGIAGYCAVEVDEGRPIELLLEVHELWLELRDQQRRTDVSGLVVLIGPHRGRDVGDVDVTHIEIGLRGIERDWQGVVDDRLHLCRAQSGFDQLARAILRQGAFVIGEEGHQAQRASNVVLVHAGRPGGVRRRRQQLLLVWSRLSAQRVLISRGAVFVALAKICMFWPCHHSAYWFGLVGSTDAVN